MRWVLLPLWVLVDLAALLVLEILWLASPFATTLLARAHARRIPVCRPVLLVHGWGLGRGSMLPVGHSLVRKCFGPVVAVGYSWFRPIDIAAGRIACMAAELAERCGVDRVDVVAHSLGGLVARAARALPEGRFIGRIVTLGTPHRGAWVGILPIGPMARAMRRDHFSALGETYAMRAGDLAVTTYADLLIPWKTATVDEPAATIIIEGGGHGTLLLDPRAARLAARHLLGETPAENAAAP